MSADFKIRTEDGYVLGCDSCQSNVATYECDDPPDPKRLLCEFCYSSFVGNATQHAGGSDAYRSEIGVMIAQAVNYLEKKLTNQENTTKGD